jgi:hypothetical protein
MTHACCPDCRLRVMTASRTVAPTCPGCDEPMVATTAVESVGYRLVAQPRPSMSAAVAAALPVPADGGTPPPDNEQ